MFLNVTSTLHSLTFIYIYISISFNILLYYYMSNVYIYIDVYKSIALLWHSGCSSDGGLNPEALAWVEGLI